MAYAIDQEYQYTSTNPLVITPAPTPTPSPTPTTPTPTPDPTPSPAPTPTPSPTPTAPTPTPTPTAPTPTSMTTITGTIYTNTARTIPLVDTSVNWAVFSFSDFVGAENDIQALDRGVSTTTSTGEISMESDQFVGNKFVAIYINDNGDQFGIEVLGE